MVVGNPPYITVKDKAENENYRKAYPSCSGKYALSVPFAERILQARDPGGSDQGAGAGYIGQITANSFMKREFGKKLIEEYFPKVDLTHVIDTSGAYIPGHGTPTVILFGRTPFAARDPRSVLSWCPGRARQPESQRRAWSGRRSSPRSISQGARANGLASPISNATVFANIPGA